MSWSLPSLAIIAPIAAPAVVGIVLGLWKDRAGGKKIMLWALLGAAACVVVSYLFWIVARSSAGSLLAPIGMGLLGLSLGVSGFAVFADRRLATTFSVAVTSIVVVAANYWMLVAYCYLFATCI